MEQKKPCPICNNALTERKISLGGSGGYHRVGLGSIWICERDETFWSDRELSVTA